MSNNTNNTLVAQINVVADEDPNTRSVIIIRPTSGVLIDAEIEPSTVDEVEALVGDSFKGTVVHMTCGFLYASIPCEDGSLMIDESRAMIVDEAEMRKHSCVEVVQQVVAKACSDRINSKLKESVTHPTQAEITVTLGQRLRLVAQLGDKRVELANHKSTARNSVIKLALDAACLVGSIAMVYMGAADSNIVICGIIWVLFSIACLPTHVPRAINTVRSLRCTKRSMSRFAAMLEELRRADKKG